MTTTDQPYKFTTSFYPPQILTTATTNGDKNVLNTSNTQQPLTNQIYNDALFIRNEVFVKEQGCSAEGEVDDDDGRSWGWVVYALPQAYQDQDQDLEKDEDGGLRKGTPVGVIRLVPPPHMSHSHLLHPTSSTEKVGYDYTHEPYIKITRVAILPSFRGKGISHLLMRTVESWAQSNRDRIGEMYSLIAREDGKSERETKKWNGLIGLHAQVQVEGMYARFGYETDSTMGRWDEEGIEHVELGEDREDREH
ncbi:GNAT family acetyltransferase, putative [Talaromyces stipitatus ATCC 10500]|uniref:GNAT family acetyltransferase, putative n=1 Tax=Talaromyces stipitatus (strain ATCC 10500 / CBS 375.48 / QM 6759 / NRRL 1006) TaxID=441959 RepID=B8M3J6_TALSN|nr:GNAT family acetyltransferase, putative [Talaromyces stipitatus ATCC 10500]EED22368.1 GNAT family acetyltransferase, putative [Talaromyces stipitatus ATCC 10500]